jgi:hypothetical protein
MYVCMFRGGFPHAQRLLCGLLYVPCEFQISRHALAPWWHRSPHLPENGGTITWQRNLKLSSGRAMSNNFAQSPLGASGSLTCSKSTTRVKRLKVPPGGLVPWIFPSLKIWRPLPGLNPRHSGHEVGTLPLDHGGCFSSISDPSKSTN